jgi:hypothetical protein
VLGCKRIFRLQADKIEGVAEDNVRLEGQLAEQCSAELCPRSGLPNDEGACSTDIDDTVVTQFPCENAGAKRAVSADVDASEENDESHRAIIEKRAGTGTFLGQPVAGKVSGRIVETRPRGAYCAIFWPMATPEQQQEYSRLAGQLQAIGQKHFKELPHGAVSLVLTLNEGHVLVEAYDRMGRKLGDIPNHWTSEEFRSELETAFAGVTLPDENVTTTVSNPMRASSA